MKSIFRKIEIEVETLGQEIERMEIDTDDFTSVYIKIKPSTYVGDEFYLVGSENSIEGSLRDILTSEDGIVALKQEIEENQQEYIDFMQEQKRQKQWYESQI